VSGSVFSYFYGPEQLEVKVEECEHTKRELEATRQRLTETQGVQHICC